MSANANNLRLDLLPKELIAHIARCADASTVLNLSLSCKKIRSAAYDSIVFRDILIDSQNGHWMQQCLDIQAIASRAGKDAEIWARYALADQKAWELSQKECPLEWPEKFVNYVPEIFVVKHPFKSDQCWKRFLRDRREQKVSQVFCLAMAILSTDDNMPQVFRSLQMEYDVYLRRDETMKAFLWALCTIALGIRISLKTRLAAWPFNHAAVVPHIAIPKASQIPLRPLNDEYNLPAPFSRRGIELLGRSTSAFGSWESWYRLHNSQALNSASWITGGTWCGYYMHFAAVAGHLDPPMIEIIFRRQNTEDYDQIPSEGFEVLAENCKDGVDDFWVSGRMFTANNEVCFSARKVYVQQRWAWDWDCRVTPFGIVGYWGTINAEDGKLQRQGFLWLWKKGWTGGASAGTSSRERVE